MSEDLILSRLGHKIRQLRLNKNMTQAELANECNFEKANLSRIETGKTNLTLSTLYRISEALGVTMNELFED